VIYLNFINLPSVIRYIGNCIKCLVKSQLIVQQCSLWCCDPDLLNSITRFQLDLLSSANDITPLDTAYYGQDNSITVSYHHPILLLWMLQLQISDTCTSYNFYYRRNSAYGNLAVHCPTSLGIVAEVENYAHYWCFIIYTSQLWYHDTLWSLHLLANHTLMLINWPVASV